MDKVGVVKPRPPLWALREDMAGKVSQELALDLGWRNWRSFESWSEYPDGRTTPEALAARRHWEIRKAELLEGLADRERPLPCSVCGEDHLTLTNRWHDQESRQADLERMAVANRLTVAEVEARLGLKTPDKTPEAAKPRTETPETPDIRDMVQASVCHHWLARPQRGPMPKFCSDACRKAMSRRKG